MTTISVVIPAYNAERTISATIESVRQQTFSDLEIIVIDDGSSDRTLEILKAVNDERLKVYSYQNGGLPTARNRGIARAEGQYISFIDADDLWTEDKLEKQLAALQANPQAGVAYSWIIIMLEARNTEEVTTYVPGKKVYFKDNVLSPLLLDNFVGNGSNILVKKDIIDSVGEFDPSLKSCEDWDYYLRLAAKSHFALVPEHQVIYRKAPGSMTSKVDVMETAGERVIDKIYQIVPQTLQQQKSKSIARFSIFCGKIFLDRNNRTISDLDVREAGKRLWKAISLDPSLLLMKDTYIFLFKILFKKLLPHQFVDNLIFALKKPFYFKNLR